MTQVVQLQSDVDAAYRECFEPVCKNLPEELGDVTDLKDITEASFGNLGRTNPQVRHFSAYTVADVSSACHSPYRKLGFL